MVGLVHSPLKGFPIRFRLHSLLAFIGLVAIALVAIQHPNRSVWLWVSGCTSLIFMSVVAIGIGSHGKLRLQCVCCCVLAFTIYVGARFPESPIWEVESLSREAIERNTNILKPRLAPNGAMVSQNEDGSFMIRRSQSTGWEQITREEIEQSQLTRYIITESNAVSNSAFIGIYRHFLALFMGLSGFVITGLAYEKRHHPTSQPR
jgi:peptidoglycan/LPS O-acetylase OafA/YrhL